VCSVPKRGNPVWALAALQAAVTLSWMAYAYHQPLLLAHFGFESLAGLLGWYLVFAGTTLAPLAGDASDRLVRSGGRRFPVVRAGVALAAASFLAVAVTARADAASPVRWVLPLFVAIWIAGMTVFQAPALAMLRDVEAAGDVAGAAAPLVVATVLPTAAWPLVEATLARLGGTMTFLAGGIAVVATAVAVGTTVDVTPPREEAPETPTGERLLLAFAGGLVSAVMVLVATDLVPARLADRAGTSAAVFGAIAGVVAALSARPAARYGVRTGAWRSIVESMLMGGTAYAGATAVGGVALGAFLAAIAGAGLALTLASTLPLALATGARTRAGLVSGLYLAGAVIGSRLPTLLLSR
jgi:hypothetical protein